jgi:hypothetical protein
MLYTANVPLIVKGDYIRRGQEFELSAEDAEQFDPADITPVGAVEEVPEPEPEEETDPEEMTHEQLKERAKALGLKTGGSKADLQERIKLHEEAPTEPEPEEEKEEDA